jgi:O-glycosyl hydrolase
VGANDIRQPGVAHAKGTKEGGTLDPDKYIQYGNWLAEGIALYKNSGIGVYALSPQNEPFFKQPFNSCFYKPEWYAQMLKGSIPVVKARFPGVKVFGSENMLAIESGKDKQYFYHSYLMSDAAAREQIDIWAVHGYLDGVAPTATSQMAQLWKTAYTEYAAPSGKSIWMTETSGYTDTWRGTSTKPGALDLGLAIHAALYHGHASAWIWWQGSDASQINEYNLMQGSSSKGKRYYVSKQFYRFIRPGAKMLEVTYQEQDGVFVSAFEHEQMGSLVMVMINNSDKQVTMNVEGTNLPQSFEQFQTTATDNCVAKGSVSKNAIVLPPLSIVTLVNGNVYEQ